MVEPIAELSAEQKARFPEFVEKWTRIALSADPANRAQAEEGVRLSYQNAGLAPPRKILWCGSPLSMGLTRHIVLNPIPSVSNSVSFLVQDSVCSSVWNSVRDSVADSVLNSVWESLNSVRALVRTSVQNSVSAAVSSSARAPVIKSVGDSVWDSVWNSVWISVEGSGGAFVVNSLWDLMRDSVGAVPSSVRSLVRDSISGQNDASWYAYYDYFRVVCGLSVETEMMLGMSRVTENAGWWMPYQEICWISERPNRVTRDDRGRIHCGDGPAITYPDGWSIYAIHGVRLDEQVVMSPQSQDMDDIRNERDAEVKRIRIERYGWPEYLRAVGAWVLDTRDNDVEVTKEALMETPDGHAVLVCACPSTSRVYCLEVPPAITTCEAAQDWLSGGLSHRVINGA